VVTLEVCPMRQDVRSIICVCAMLLASATAAPAQSPVTYVYDELGRLVAVTDAAGDTATYAYDAVGNLLAIARVNAATQSIVEFTPNGGPIGATVTISGTGFDPVATQNTVAFNGTAATVTTATANQLTVTVPSGATSGTVSVTTSSGTATSDDPFAVTAAAVPVITGFTPTIGSAGTAVTVSGSNFDPVLLNNRLRFNATMGTVSSSTGSAIGTTVPAAVGGRIRISTPAGAAVSADDFFIPPPPYTATDVQYTNRMTFGDSRAVAITTSGKIGLVLFDGTAGQRTSLKAVPGVLGTTSIYRPDGALLVDRTLSTTGLLEPPLLPMTGSYGIAVDPNGASTGTTTVTLYDVPADFTSPITPGGSAVTATMGTPGQNGRVTFTGAVDQRISLRVSSGPIGTVTIQKPDGTTLATTSVTVIQQFIDTHALAAAGTYGIVVNPAEANTGSVTLTLYDVPTDVTNTIVPGGSAVTTTFTTPGQNGQLTFSGTASQRVSLKMGGGPIASIAMKNPDTTTFASGSSNVLTTFIDTQTLSSTGTHSIAIDPGGTATGSLTFTLYDVPADVTGSLTVGASAVPVTITTAGQNGAFTFAGTSSQQVTVRITSNTVPNLTVKLLKPDGSQLTSSTSSASSFNLATQTLPTTGTYTVVIDPAQWNTGSFDIQVTNP
jgi:YD repeat-containing protein